MKPISMDTLLREARKIRKGRRNKRTEEEVWNDLFPILQRYCFKVAMKYSSDLDERKDYVAQGINGAIKAVDNFWYVCSCRKRFHTLDDFNSHDCLHAGNGPCMSLEDYVKGSMRSYMNRFFKDRMKYVYPERSEIFDIMSHLHWTDPLALDLLGNTTEAVEIETDISDKVRETIEILKKDGDKKAVIVLAGIYSGMEKDEIIEGLRGLFDIDLKEAVSIVSKAFFRINKVTDGRVRVTAMSIS